MSTPPIDKLEILVGDFAADATLIHHEGVHTLFLREQQIASSAARHVCHLIPGLPYEAAEALIRDQCPELKDLDDMLGLLDQPAPSVERPVEIPVPVVREVPRLKRRRRAVLVAALLPALAASWAVGRYTNVVESTPGTATASAPDAAPGPTGESKGPFAAPKFLRFAGAGNIDCNPISPLQAECTDADGMVMSTKAATGPDSTIFTFSYGAERIGLRIFYDAEYADTWARQKGTQELYPHLRQRGRYVLWGTDPSRIKEYDDLLAEENRHGQPLALGMGTPLPPRLAALTLGTLGLDSSQVGQLIADDQRTGGDVPVLMAARMVLGMDTAPPNVRDEVDDIVAIAVGIEPTPPPPTVGKTKPTGGSVTPTAPVTTPSTDTKAPTEPILTTPPTVPVEPTPTTPVEPEPVEPTPPPTETVPVEPEPTAPVEPEPTAPAEPEPAEPEPVEPEPTAPVEPPPTEPTPPSTDPTNPDEPVPPPAVEPVLPAPTEEAPAELPAETGQGTGGNDDLVILNSAWTVAA